VDLLTEPQDLARVVAEIRGEIEGRAGKSKRMLVKTLFRRFGFKSKTQKRTAFLRELLAGGGIRVSPGLEEVSRDDWVVLTLPDTADTTEAATAVDPAPTTASREWLRPQTFKDLGVPESVVTVSLLELEPTLNMEPIQPAIAPELYTYFFQLGGQLLSRTNISGQLELLALLESDLSAARDAQHELQVAESANSRFSVSLLILDDPENPLELPFMFNLTDLNDRYKAVALCEQPKIPLYFLVARGNGLFVAFARVLSFDDTVRGTLREGLYRAAGLEPPGGDALPERAVPHERLGVEPRESRLASNEAPSGEGRWSIQGFLNRLLASWKESRESEQKRAELRELVLEAVSDGILTQEDIHRIESKRQKLGLSIDDMRTFRTMVYMTAVKAVQKDKRLTPAEAESLSRIAEHFGVEPTTVERTQRHLAKYRLLYEIEQGNLPYVTVPGLVLQKGEECFWSEPGELLEERVVRRRYGGGSSGFSVRLAKGVYWRVGGHRGSIQRETELQAVSVGELILTNKRLIFRGDRKNVNAKWDKLLAVNVFLDGLQVSLVNRQKPILIRFRDRESTDIVAAIVCHCMNKWS